MIYLWAATGLFVLWCIGSAIQRWWKCQKVLIEHKHYMRMLNSFIDMSGDSRGACITMIEILTKRHDRRYARLHHALIAHALDGIPITTERIADTLETIIKMEKK